MAESSLKNQAEEIMAAVSRELQGTESGVQIVDQQTDSKGSGSALMDSLFKMVSKVDVQAAEERVQALRAENPNASTEEIVQKLIRDKCKRTAAVGAATSGTALIPGVGTAAALTLGVAADIGATFKLQAELVLEIAAAYNYPLTEDEKQQVVMVITGLSAGTVALAQRVGKRAALRLGEKYAEKAIVKALPVIGVISSAGTNVLSTYIIGQRADAYFRLGPEAVGSWADSLRAITGFDERQMKSWLAEGGRTAGAVLVVGADKVGSGAKVAGRTAQKGLRAYLGWLIYVWSAIFGFLWAVITFIPRKLKGSKQKSVPPAIPTASTENRSPVEAEESENQFE